MRFFQVSWLWFVVLLGVLPQTLLAAGFTITPFSQEIPIEDEERATFNVSVKNEGTTETKLRLTAIDFGSLDISGGAAFLGAQGNPETRYALANWISLDQQDLLLTPGESAVVNGFIENRADLSPGGHYAAILFRETDTAPSLRESNYIAVDQAFAALLLVKKMGGGLEKLTLKSVDFSSTIFTLPQKFNLSFRNEGNIHVTPRGKLSVVDPVGRVVKEGIVNEESGIILPGSERVFSLKPYEIEKAYIPGYYRLGLEYRFDGREAGEVWEKSVFLVPPVAIGTLLCGGIFGVWYGQKIWRRRRKQAQKSQG